MDDYQQKIQLAREELENKLKQLSEINIQKLEAQKAEYLKKIEEIDDQIHAALAAAGIDFSGNKGCRSKRLPKLVPGSKDWEKAANQIAIVMKNYPEGLNGKQIAFKMGLTAANEIMRIQPVIKATLQKSGQKASTKYKLK